MTAAPVESCQAMVQRSPRGRFWSLVDVRKRPHRTCGGFHRCIHISNKVAKSTIREALTEPLI